MANREDSMKETSKARPDYLTPLIVPYSYLNASEQASNEVYFAERALTISRGAKVVADILRMDVIERDSGRNPVLDVNGIESLAGLLSESLFMLGELAEGRLDAINCGKA
jgi:hypothetical protein